MIIPPSVSTYDAWCHDSLSNLIYVVVWATWGSYFPPFGEAWMYAQYHEGDGIWQDIPGQENLIMSPLLHEKVYTYLATQKGITVSVRGAVKYKRPLGSWQYKYGNTLSVYLPPKIGDDEAPYVTTGSVMFRSDLEVMAWAHGFPGEHDTNSLWIQYRRAGDAVWEDTSAASVARNEVQSIYRNVTVDKFTNYEFRAALSYNGTTIYGEIRTVGRVGAGIVGTAWQQYPFGISPITMPCQRKSFIGAGHYWGFWSDGYALKYNSRASDPDELWGTPVTLRIQAGAGYCLDLYWDGSVIHVVTSSPWASGAEHPCYYHRGVPQTDGTISWATPVTVMTAPTNQYVGYAHITVDSAGYPVIAYSRGTMSQYYIRGKIATSQNGSTWGAEMNIDITSGVHYGARLIPLASRKLMIVYNHGSLGARYSLWNGSSWSTPAAAPTGTSIKSVVTTGYDVMVATGAHVYQWAGASWEVSDDEASGAHRLCGWESDGAIVVSRVGDDFFVTPYLGGEWFMRYQIEVPDIVATVRDFNIDYDPTSGGIGLLWAEGTTTYQEIKHYVIRDIQFIPRREEQPVVPGYIWVEREYFAYTDSACLKRLIKGNWTIQAGVPGYCWVDGTGLRYTDWTGRVRYLDGFLTGLAGVTYGQISINTRTGLDGEAICWVDSAGKERGIRGAPAP